MKPHKIVMQAFGPYLNKTTIDFTALYKYGLFLITGATGCGKTTILDAMSYALYGRTSGSLRDVRDMRSTAAPDTLETSVSFEMELGGSRYKFERGMRIREVKKRSGESENVTDYEESCFTYDGEKWRLICTGPQVKDKAVELLGFSHEQFSQVVVLPQGEFRRLLIAPSLEKQKILETLFGTARWQSFTRSLALRSKSLETALSQCVEKSSTLCKSAECENPQALDILLSQSKDELRAIESGMKKFVAAFDAASAALSGAIALEQKFSEIDAARERVKQLATQADEIVKKRGNLDTAEKALSLAPYLDALKQAKKALDTAQKNMDAAKHGLDSARKEEKEAQKSLDGYADGDARLKELAGVIARLEGVLAPSRALCSAAAALAVKKQEQKAACDRSDRVDSHVKQLAAACDSLKARIKENSDRYVAHLPELVAQKSELAARVDAFTTLETQSRTVVTLKKSLNAKLSEYKIISQSLKNEKQALENMQKAIDGDAAYHFAQELHDGGRCPVCGSIFHPAPAAAVSGAPSKEEIETQKQVIETQSENQKQIVEEGARIRGEYDAANKRFDEISAECEKYGCSGEEARLQLAITAKALDEAQAAVKRQREMENEEKAGETALLAAKKQFDGLKAQTDRAALEVSTLEGRVSQLSDAVPEEMRDAGAVEARVNAVKKDYEDTAKRIKDARSRFETSSSAFAAANERLRSAMDAKAAATKSFEAAGAEYERRFGLSGLTNGANVRALILTKEERDSLKSSIEGFDRETNLQKDKAAALEKQLACLERPDTQTLKEQEAKARANMEQALSQKGALEAKAKNLEGVKIQLIETAAREAKLRDEFALYDHIFRLSNGENPLKTPIHQFVLGLMLDDIVASANGHLSQLSRGRYNLVRSAQPTRGGGTKGLELSVGDAWSGGERSVSTLSGGEMFLASLSLAFGLSDVVQSYAGGIRLDSLFIDEGFGSLDTETLDTAMGALERLRLSGRLIGVISHVGELCERIPAHIEVKRLADSTAAVTVETP